MYISFNTIIKKYKKQKAKNILNVKLMFGIIDKGEQQYEFREFK